MPQPTSTLTDHREAGQDGYKGDNNYKRKVESSLAKLSAGTNIQEIVNACRQLVWRRAYTCASLYGRAYVNHPSA